MAVRSLCFRFGFEGRFLVFDYCLLFTVIDERYANICHEYEW